MTTLKYQRVIPPEIYDQLWDSNSEFRRVNKDGRREVGVVRHNKCLLYIKKCPAIPGLEHSVGVFIRKLIGFGAPHVELAMINETPFLISHGIHGKSLREILKDKDADEFLKNKLDKVSTSFLIIASMMVNPEDGNLYVSIKYHAHVTNNNCNYSYKDNDNYNYNYNHNYNYYCNYTCNYNYYQLRNRV